MNWDSFPFACSKKFNNKEIEKIWNDYYTSQKLSKHDNLKYDLLYEKDNLFYAIIMNSNDKNKVEDIKILKYPKTINIYNKEKSIKNLKIYTEKQYVCIISLLKLNNYDIKVKQNNKILIYDETIIYEKDIIIEAHHIGVDIFENFKYYTIREKINIPSNEIITIEKHKLSLYFNEISKINNFQKDFKLEKDFKILIDEKRLNFIENINNFMKSKNIFYFIMGTKGIGKTITLLYYSSCINDNFRILYLNLKLFLKCDKYKIKDIFFNELKRLFLLEKKFEKLLKLYFIDYKDLIDKIEKNTKEKEEKNTKIQYFWSLLFSFVKNYQSLGLEKQNLLIILDQYKRNDIDDDFINLDNLESYIKNNFDQISFKVKLMVVISINNHDTKKIFIDNINTFSYNSNLQLNEKFPNIENGNQSCDNKDKISNAKRNNYSFKNIENYLNNKKSEIEKGFKKDIIESLKFYYLSSCSLVNFSFESITQKEYLNNLTNCSKLINNNFWKNYINCLKAFNFSFKYYQLLLNEINQNEKDKNEKEEDFQKRIIKNFYFKIYEKISNSIKKGYQLYFYKNHKLFVSDDIISKFLIKLRNDIYNENFYTIHNIKNKLEEIPLKYFSLILDYSKSNIPSKEKPFGTYYFKIKYSNNFVKHAINKMISELSHNENYNECLGFGEEFEKRVNEKLSNLIYHNKNIIKRNIFSFADLSKSLKNYINKLKQKEETEFYDFFGLRRLLDISIDGIEEERIKSSIFNIKDYDVFLNQISQNGRSFYSGLLIKKDQITDSKTHDLVLTQETTGKYLNKGKKMKYIYDCYLSKKFLENLYEGLKIDKIYFLFIIPLNYPNNDDTKKKLEEFQIYYLYYSDKEKIFVNKDYQKVIDLRINLANITFPEYKNYTYIKSLSNIQTCKNIFELSKKKYLNEIGTLSFAEIYKQISEENFHNCIIFSIPKNFEDKILECFYDEKYFSIYDNIIFLPSTNYNGNRIKDLFNETKNMILFSYNNNIYFYYYYFYKIEKIYDDFKIEKITDLIIDINYINTVYPNQDFEDFEKIKEYPLFLFCYQIIKNFSC